MAKKRPGGVNVSEAIRRYLSDHPDLGPSEVAKGVSAQIGQPVDPTYVSNVKNLMKKKEKAERRAAKQAAKAAAPAARGGAATARNGSVDLNTIEAVKQVVGRVGPQTAKRLIEILS